MQNTGVSVLVLALALLGAACNKDSNKGTATSTASASPSAKEDDEANPRELQTVRCNKTPIKGTRTSANEGATPEAAVMLFLSTQKAKKKEEGHVAFSSLHTLGNYDPKLYYARKNGKTVETIEPANNIDGPGYFVRQYEVCPAND